MNFRIKILLIIIMILFTSDCKKNESQNTNTSNSNGEVIEEEDLPLTREEIKNPIVPNPLNFKTIAETKGDLDGDDLDELVVIYDTPQKDELGTLRELHIYKRGGDKWNFLHKSIGPVLSSMAGGMMGDPFESIRIENGAIVIYHFGGSREKWMYTHRFRFQNEGWYLIGATIEYSIVCEESTSYDYNISTGKINWIHSKESCDKEGNQKGKVKDTKSSYTLKEKQIVPMDGFVPGNTEVKLSKDKSFFF